MIYNSMITSVNESDILDILENAEDRFENETMAEATAIVVGEAEANWTRFMQGVGLSELASIMEGQEIIYEGGRLSKFIDKAKGFFQRILSKLAELTKSFIAKIDQVLKTNDAFVKKYRSTLTNIKYDKLDLTIQGYEFDHIKPHTYPLDSRAKSVDYNAASSIVDHKDIYSRESAENNLVNISGDTFGERLNKWFYKDGKKSIKIDKGYIDDQLDIISGTKKLKEEAKKSYKEAAKKIKDIISELKKADSKFGKEVGKGEHGDLGANTGVSSAFNILLNYWKSYASACTQYHGAYMTMLGKRNRQARAACTKALTAGNKAKGTADREKIKAKTEGFVDTSDFLGAVDFI